MKFQAVKIKGRNWRGLSAKNCNSKSKCAGVRLRGKYIVSTDSQGRSKLKIEGRLQSAGLRNKSKALGIFSALQNKVLGGTEWAAL